MFLSLHQILHAKILLLLILSVFTFSSYGNSGNNCADVFSSSKKARGVQYNNEGTKYYDGIGVERDYQRALSYLKKGQN